ncbi:polyubiquitin-like [Hypanus sabinus]|uniref:polyubiquitin-like n=1 Tax=Hypanus sabinus TaxID=79690 RepID=UPI0028C4A116|nr:polyubiquitin-like [Hypanus sabinus]
MCRRCALRSRSRNPINQTVQKVTITVTALDGKSLQLHLIVHARISAIKRSLEEEWKIPAPLQRLVYHGTFMNDDKTLLDSNIFVETEIQLIRLMEIIVQLPEENRAVKVSQIDKVSNLKNQIESQTSLRKTQYYLTFQSQALEDGRTLQSYGIQHNSTITVNLRLHGGRDN